MTSSGIHACAKPCAPMPIARPHLGSIPAKNRPVGCTAATRTTCLSTPSGEGTKQCNGKDGSPTSLASRAWPVLNPYQPLIIPFNLSTTRAHLHLRGLAPTRIPTEAFHI